MAVTYTNFLSGTITDNPLLIGGTTVNGSALASMPAITGSDTMWLVLDPDGANGAPEIVSVTAHTAAATSATIARAQQSTTAREHPAGTVFRVAATKSDLDELPFRKMTTTGDIMYASAANVAARLAIGSAGLPLVAGASVPGYAALAAGGLASDSVTTVKILDANVTTPKIADGNVTTVKIADGAVTSTKFAPTKVVLTYASTLADTFTAITGWTETSDADGMHSAGTVTIPATGTWALATRLRANSASADAISLRFNLNGNADAAPFIASTPATNFNTWHPAGDVLYLTSGDTIVFQGKCDTADIARNHDIIVSLVRLA